MKNFKIKKIRIENFKGIRAFETELGQRTTISGANATGKTSIIGAFLWTLFGKDSQDRTDSGRGSFGIKTVNEQGNIIEKLNHEVTVWLTCGGQTLELTRRLSERWVKKARATEPVFEGNTTTCIWNGVEIGVNEWNKRIEEHIMPIGLFKMLTNPRYFPNLPWQEQLDVLTKMIGNVTAEDIAEGNPEYKAALEGIGAGNSIQDRITTITTEHRRLKKRIDEIPSEIKGINSATPAAPDYGELECEQNALLAEQEGIDAALHSEAEAERQHYEAIKDKQQELSETEQRMNAVYITALSAANEQIVQKNAARNDAEAKLRIATQNLGAMEQKIQEVRAKYARDRKAKEDEIARLEAQREGLLKLWDETDSEEYAGGQVLICPLLGIACDSAQAHARHAEDEDKARQAFNTKKNAELDKIEQQGGLVGSQLEHARNELTTLEQEYIETDKNNEAAKAGLAAEYEKAKQELAKMTKAEPVTHLDKKGIPEWMELHKKAETLRKDIEEMGNGERKESDTERMQRKQAIRSRLDQIAAELAKEQLIADNDAKVEKLNDEMDNVAQQMADLEKERDTIKAMERAVVDEVERRVNEKFRLVKFRTCDWQINGEPVQTCYAMLDGVKYSDLNSAGQVNAGLDIIDTLCRECDTTAPIFIDNAEGVNSLVETDSQQIRLVVTTDSQLNVTIEEE